MTNDTKPTTTYRELCNIWDAHKVTDLRSSLAWWTEKNVPLQVWFCARINPRVGFGAAASACRELAPPTSNSALTALYAADKLYAGGLPDEDFNIAILANRLRTERRHTYARLVDAIDYFLRVRKYSGMYSHIAMSLHFAMTALPTGKIHTEWWDKAMDTRLTP